MKNLLLSISVLALLASCGKSNSTGDQAAANAAAVAPVTNTITVADATAVQLGNLIDASESYFVAAPAAYYKYYYATQTAQTSANNCTTGTKWGIPYYICNSGSGSNTGVTQSSVYASSVDLVTKRNELKAIINSSAPGYISQSGSMWIVRTQAGVIYTISQSAPLQANPVQVQQANGQITYFQGIAQ